LFHFSFTDLTLLVMRHNEHPACKKRMFVVGSDDLLVL